MSIHHGKTTIKREHWEWFTSQLAEYSDIKWIGGQSFDEFDPFKMEKQITVCCHRKGLGIILDPDNCKISNLEFFKKCEEIFPKKEESELEK